VSLQRTRTAADIGIGTGVGAFSGAFGVGGGILLVPFLVLVRKVPQKRAQATSLVLVGMAAAAGAVRYAVNGDVAWLPALVILLGGLAGAWLGAHIVQRSPNAVLQVAFGVVLMVAGVRMLWPSPDAVDSSAFLPEMSPALAAGYAAPGYTQWGEGARLGAGAMVGAVVGASVALAISGSVLQIAFGVMMLAVAVQMGLRGWRSRGDG